MSSEVIKPPVEGTAPPPQAQSAAAPIPPAPLALVTVKDLNALIASKNFKSHTKGLEFRVNEKGDLISVTREDLDEVVESLAGLGEAHTWWLGDIAAAYYELFGTDALAPLAERLNQKVEKVRKQASISRSFGFPNKTREMRHPDPKVTHQHHILVMGLKDNAQRMKLLNEASQEKLTTAQLYERVKSMKAGPGADPDPNAFGMFHVSHRAWDPATDNKEQYLAELYKKIEEVEFPDYVDPELRKARLAKEARQKLIKSLPEKTQEEMMTNPEYVNLSEEAFAKLAGEVTARHKERERINSFAKTSMKKNEKLRVEMLALQKENKWSFDEFKEQVKTRKQQIRDAKSDEDKITKAIAKIKNEVKRTEIYELVEKEKLGWPQVESIVNEILVEEMTADQADKIKKESAERLANLEQKNRDKLAGVKRSPTDALPLGKKPIPVKKR